VKKSAKIAEAQTILKALGLTQLKISALLHGRLEGFSMDRLVRFLNALDQDVKISIRPKAKARPVINVA
jgi:predicted XRE-type DNA-binding protein